MERGQEQPGQDTARTIRWGVIQVGGGPEISPAASRKFKNIILVLF